MAMNKPQRGLQHSELWVLPDPVRFAYSRWDGNQSGFDLDADHLLDELADDLLYHGALDGALRRLLADGLLDRSGRSIEGLHSMLERLREQRRQLQEQLQQQLQQLDIGDLTSAEAAQRFAELSARLGELSARLGELNMHMQPNANPAVAPQVTQVTESGELITEAQLQQLMDMLSQLADIESLEKLLKGAAKPSDLAAADRTALSALLGDNAAESLRALAEIMSLLAEAGLVDSQQQHLEMTPRLIRKIGQSALRDLFKRLNPDLLGHHSIARTGLGHERDALTKAYSYGDPFNLHIGQTIRNAVTRNGGGIPVRLHPDDFEVQQTEQQVRSATVLMVDLSLSMPMRNNFLPAKKVAMALHALISSQYRNDYLGLVSFSETAQELRADQLPAASWDYVYGTNMHHGLILARAMLRQQSGNKQIIMITDGEPTAHLTASGQAFFSYPPTRETLDRTLAEVAGCTREGIRINTFMLDATPYLTDFVEQVTALNGGRAFLTTNENLGEYVLVDFVEHKRSLITAD